MSFVEITLGYYRSSIKQNTGEFFFHHVRSEIRKLDPTTMWTCCEYDWGDFWAKPLMIAGPVPMQVYITQKNEI